MPVLGLMGVRDHFPLTVVVQFFVNQIVSNIFRVKVPMWTACWILKCRIHILERYTGQVGPHFPAGLHTQTWVQKLINGEGQDVPFLLVLERTTCICNALSAIQFISWCGTLLAAIIPSIVSAERWPAFYVNNTIDLMAGDASARHYPSSFWSELLDHCLCQVTHCFPENGLGSL